MAVRSLSPAERDVGAVVETVRQLAQGRSDAVGAFTVAINSLATTVYSPTIGPQSVVFLQALSMSSAGLQCGVSTTNVSYTSHHFVVNHSTTNTTPLNFAWLAIG